MSTRAAAIVGTARTPIGKGYRGVFNDTSGAAARRPREAFASQAVQCRDVLGINPEQMNADGGAIAVGHP
jgi:acetyl-CoA acetyltransferase